LGSELQQEELFDLLFDPGASSLMVNISLVTKPLAVFTFVGAHSTTANAQASTTICNYSKNLFSEG
jgi:hypothetical protein